MLSLFSRDFRKRFRQINFIYYYIAFFEYGNIRHASTRKKITKIGAVSENYLLRRDLYTKKE